MPGIAINPPDWFRPWIAGEYNYDPQDIEWVRSRPDSVKALMLAFPPSCVVRAVDGRKLYCPAPGHLGIVTSYIKGGTLTVRDGPDGGVRFECQPDWLEVVGYWSGLTPQIMAEILAAQIGE